MADFAHYLPLLLANEGGYVFDPHDPGGETWCGIARNYNPHWSGWPLIDNYKAQPTWPANCQVYPRNQLATAVLDKDATMAGLVRSFYQAQYWDSVQLGGLANQSIANQLCDAGVNSGTGRVGHLAQYVLANSFAWAGTCDGLMGPHTVAAINAAPAPAYYNALVALRQAFYRYRADEPGGLPAGEVSFLQHVDVVPDASMQQYLPSWLGRIQAIPFTA